MGLTIIRRSRRLSCSIERDPNARLQRGQGNGFGRNAAPVLKARNIGANG